MNEIMNIHGIECYEKNGTAYLKLEAVARGLGFTKTDVKISETGFRKEYVRIDWPRVNKYLAELGFSPQVGKDTFIPENIFYRLAMKAKNETAERFQALVADEIIPSIRRTGSYGNGTERLAEQVAAMAEQMGKLTEVVTSIATFTAMQQASPALERQKRPEQLTLQTTLQAQGIYSARDLLKFNELGLSVVEFNKRMEDKGYMEEITISPLRKGKDRRYKVLTAKGLEYGENRERIRENKYPQPGYYADSFLVLYKKVTEKEGGS